MYNTRSAMTNPTVKKILEEGRKEINIVDNPNIITQP